MIIESNFHWIFRGCPNVRVTNLNSWENASHCFDSPGVITRDPPTFPALFSKPYRTQPKSLSTSVWLVRESRLKSFKLFLGEMYIMVFCYQNCSDLLWEKIVLVIDKKKKKNRDWRPRIFKIFEVTRTIYSNSQRSE